MLATVDSCVLAGLEARRVEVQADSANGEPKFFLVGLAATSVKEARERVRSAIKNSGLAFPGKRLTVNLAPAEMRKTGSGLDNGSRNRARGNGWARARALRVSR